MFNIVKAHKDYSDQYGQNNQPNPLRYQFAQRNKRDINLLGAPMSCRDFFNDAVSAYHGYTKQHYGFDTSKIKFNRYGMYVYYTRIHDPEQFVHNIEQAINPRLLTDTGKEVVCHVHDASSVVVRFPTEVLKYTWRISLLTQLIRNCNWRISYNSWDDLFNEWPEAENSMDTITRNFVQTQGFNPPFDAWWYSNPQYNGNKIPSDGGPMGSYMGTIHGNGCYAQTRAAILEKLIKV